MAVQVGELFYLLGLDADPLAKGLDEAKAHAAAAGKAGSDDLGKIGAAAKKAGHDIGDSMAAGAQKAETAIGQAHQNTSTALQNLQDESKKAASGVGEAMSGIKGVLAGLGVGAILHKSLDDYREYTRGIAETFTLIPTASEAVKTKIKSDLDEMDLKYGILSTDSIPAMYQALSAGVPPENVVTFLATSAQVATGGATDLKTAVDALTGATNTWRSSNLTAADAGDIFFTTVKLGKTTMAELSAALPEVGSAAAAVGIGLDQVGASLATLTVNNVTTASAATGLGAAFAELNKSGQQAADNFERASGQSFRKFIANGHTVAEAVTALDAYAKKSGRTVMEMFGGQEAGQLFQALASNVETLNGNLDAMGTRAGAVREAFTAMADTTDMRQRQAAEAMHQAIRDVGEQLTPLLEIGAKLAASVAGFGANLAQNHTTKILVGITAALIGLAVAGNMVAGILTGPMVVAVRSLVAALWAETAAGNAAATAQTRLAAARGMAARSAVGSAATAAMWGAGAAIPGVGGAVVGTAGFAGAAAVPAALALPLILAGATVASDAGRARLEQGNADRGMSNLGGVTAFGQVTGHVVDDILPGHLIDRATGYQGAMNAAKQDDRLQDAILRAGIARNAAAKAAIMEQKEATEGLTAADQLRLKALKDGSPEAIKAVQDTAQALDDALAKSEASYRASFNIFDTLPERMKAGTAYSKTDRDADKESVRLAQDKIHEQEAKVVELRKKGAKGTDDLKTAERELAQQRLSLSQAQDRILDKDKASKPKDQSLSVKELQSLAAGQAKFQTQRASDLQTLRNKGMTDEGLSQLLDIEKSHPGTIRRIVAEGVKAPWVKEVNRSLKTVALDSAAIRTIGSALANQLEPAAVHAGKVAGKSGAQAMAKAFSDHLNGMGLGDWIPAGAPGGPPRAPRGMSPGELQRWMERHSADTTGAGSL